MMASRVGGSHTSNSAARRHGSKCAGMFAISVAAVVVEAELLVAVAVVAVVVVVVKVEVVLAFC